MEKKRNSRWPPIDINFLRNLKCVLVDQETNEKSKMATDGQDIHREFEMGTCEPVYKKLGQSARKWKNSRWPPINMTNLVT